MNLKWNKKELDDLKIVLVVIFLIAMCQSKTFFDIQLWFVMQANQTPHFLIIIIMSLRVFWATFSKSFSRRFRLGCLYKKISRG